MRIGLQKTTKTVVIIATLAFCAWWWLHSCAAYRNVVPTITMPEAELDAWKQGICDMNEYMTFRNYPVFLCCAVLLAIVGLIPERNKDKGEE